MRVDEVVVKLLCYILVGLFLSIKFGKKDFERCIAWTFLWPFIAICIFVPSIFKVFFDGFFKITILDLEEALKSDREE